MVRRTSEWRRNFCATAMPALRTTAVPPEWRVSWKRTCRGTGFAQSDGLPQLRAGLRERRGGPQLLPAAVRGPAAMLVALDEAGAGDGGPEHPVESQLARVHGAVGPREHERAGRLAQGLREARPELIGDGHRLRLAVLRARRIPGPVHHDDAGREVHVLLAQPEDLPLVHHRVEAGGHRALPFGRDLREHRLPLQGREDLLRPRNHLGPLDLLDGVLAPLPRSTGLPRNREDVEQVAAQVVPGLGAESVHLVGEEALDAGGRHFAQRRPPDGRAQVLEQEWPHRRRAQRLALLLPPPVEEGAEGHRERFAAGRVETEPLPAGLLLNLSEPPPSELLRGPGREGQSVAARGHHGLLPLAAAAVDPLDDHPAVLPLQHRAHSDLLPSARIPGYPIVPREIPDCVGSKPEERPDANGGKRPLPAELVDHRQRDPEKAGHVLGSPECVGDSRRCGRWVHGDLWKAHGPAALPGT